MYIKFNFGISAIAKKFRHGPDKINQVLEKFNIPLKTKGGQFGKLNGMFGKRRGYTGYFKGHSHTQLAKQQISKSLTKPILVNGVEYQSRSDACKCLEISYSTFKRYTKIGILKLEIK